ncbi:hypothetical protein AB3S75_002608 [Citrus x aurantiifolia]
MEIKYFVHEHPLTLCEDNNNGKILCELCGNPCFGESYSCTNCGVYANPCSACNKEVTSGSFYICEMCWPQSPLFHQSCVDLEEDICITHYRPHCVLHFERESSDEPDELDCDFCRQTHREFKYCCGDCDFQIGVGCASMLSKYHQGQQHVEHRSHRHPLTLMKLHDIDMNCKLCSKSINGPACGCAPCEFYIHNSCRDEFPQEIRHPFHPRHSLQLLDGEPNRYHCDACQFNIQGLRYRCDMCDFDLHLECSSLKPNVEYKGHQHLLILIENMFYHSICEACGFGIEGVYSTRCVRCDLDFHVQCGSDPLPPSVWHKDHEHPLIENNETIGSKDDSQLHFCNVCGKENNPKYPFYCCVECKYFAHVCCAITEIQYDEKGKLRHFSHRHILILHEIHKNGDDTFCHGCRRAIQGPTYGCTPCKFYLHKSCVDLPRQIHHQSHEHYLTLERSELLVEQSTCHSCGKHFDGFIYHCASCDKFDLDIVCASEHPAVNLAVYNRGCESHEGQERMGHFSHEHHLVALEIVNVHCNLCNKNIDGQCYGCVECEFYIHNSCCELPKEVRHPFHQHPLTLLVAEESMYRCDACRFDIQGFRYRCDACDFDLHPDCISLKANIKYSGHEHLLTLIENMFYDGECEACGFTTDGASFLRCIECKLNFHVEYCGPHSPPPTVMVIQHEHHLTLLTETLAEDNPDRSYCTVCEKKINPEHPTYCCADCKYYAHPGCVIAELQGDERQKATKHFSHEHLLFLYENERNDDTYCDGCFNNIQANDLVYGCDPCRFYLHKSCAELPKERQHPFHRHPLFLSDCFGKCNTCRKDVRGFCYLCEDCDFVLDLDCSSLLPSIKLESVHDKHTLTFFRKLYSTPECGRCRSYNIPPYELNPLDLSYICCVKCNLNWHLLCFPMPQTIDHHSHLHSLTLKDKCVELSSHCYDYQYYCDFCETIRDGRECVYHCENCNFVVDLECVFSEGMQFLEGKSKDVEWRFVGKSGLTYSYKYIFENLTPEEKRTMESTQEGIFEEPEKTQEGTHEDIFKELKKIDDRISKKWPSSAKCLLKCVAKEHVQGLLQLGYIDKDAGLELVDVGGYKINPNLAPVLNKLLDKHGDIGASCPLTPKLKTIALITLCAIMEIMNSTKVRNLDVASIIMWWFLLKLVQKAGFKVDFALDRLKRIARDFFTKI